MEYTPMEKDILAMMQRTDFKNLSKGDLKRLFCSSSNKTTRRKCV